MRVNYLMPVTQWLTRPLQMQIALDASWVLGWGRDLDADKQHGNPGHRTQDIRKRVC